MRAIVLGAALLLAAHVVARAQPPDTVFFEDLTFDELRDAIRGGATNVIIAAGGSDDAADRLVIGRPTDVVTYTADRIAREVGRTLVAPVIPYAPGGVIPLKEEAFAQLLAAAATSARASGFRNIFLLGDGRQPALNAIAVKLDAAWRADGIRVVSISAADDAGGAASPHDAAAELVAINAQRVRLERLGNDAAVTPQQGLARLQHLVDSAVFQIRAVAGRATSAAVSTSSPGARVLPTPDPRSSSSPSLFLEDLTSTEIRDRVAAGHTVVIVPTGGTEKNGFHMALGKHNFHVRAGAELLARKLGNALVAPVLQYVPESQATEATPGVLSCARDCFEPVVESVTRSARHLGFTDILLIGDNGGNQASLSAVAGRLNAEWAETGARAFALTDFYDKGHEYQDVWFLSQYGWDESVVGSHAGVKDTSQMLYVKPQDVRINRIADSVQNRQESSISGDPTKATAEFGRIGIEFKVNGALAQYRRLKASTGSGESEGQRRPGRRGNR